MPARVPADRQLCVVLHDVSPATWNGCTEVLRVLARCAQEAGRTLPLTLLVVPRRHGDPRVPPAYRRWLQRLARRGHEVALHGLTHHDSGPPPRRWPERWLREHYTAREGEFAALDAEQAAQRLAEGRRWLREQGLQARGFVAPAWLMSEGAARAVAEAGFAWTCTLTTLTAWPGPASARAPAFAYSTRSAPRRALSLAWHGVTALRARDAPLVRLELHPDDAAWSAVRRAWSRWLVQALATRTPVTLGEAAAQLREPGTPPALRAA